MRQRKDIGGGVTCSLESGSGEDGSWSGRQLASADVEYGGMNMLGIFVSAKGQNRRGIRSRDTQPGNAISSWTISSGNNQPLVCPTCQSLASVFRRPPSSIPDAEWNPSGKIDTPRY